MIYFLQPIDGGPIKIGFTDNLDARVQALESHYGRPLALLATLGGGREQEAELHQRFGHLRFGRTEQFRPAPELLAFIGRPLLVDPNPDAVEAMPGVTAVTAIRSRPEWKEWLERLAEFDRAPSVNDLADRAFIAYARQVGFKEVAPPR